MMPNCETNIGSMDGIRDTAIQWRPDDAVDLINAMNATGRTQLTPSDYTLTLRQLLEMSIIFL